MIDDFRVVPEETFSIVIGDKTFSGFKKESTWNNLSKYVDKNGQYIICLVTNNVANFLDMFQPDDKKGEGHVPILASPKLQELILEKAKALEAQQINEIVEVIACKIREEDGWDFAWKDDKDRPSQVAVLDADETKRSLLEMVLMHRKRADGTGWNEAYECALPKEVIEKNG